MPPKPSQGGASRIFSLYRGYLREVLRLPHLYLRQFYKVKARDDIESMLSCRSGHILNKKLERMRKEQQKLESANKGHVKSFQHILQLAYARKGKLKWQLLEPLRKAALQPIHPRIIPTVEKSRPPAYSPALVSLLTNPHARKPKKALKQGSWTPSALLPPRANPQSEEARMLGPFSKRREFNIQWRYFKKQYNSLYPPLELQPEDAETSLPAADAKLQQSAIPDFGLIEDIETLVGLTPQIPLTRKEIHAMDVTQPIVSKPRHPSLWVRRRYRELLKDLPLLKRSSSKEDDKLDRYATSISPYSLGSLAAPTIRQIDAASLAWVEQGFQSSNKDKITKGGRNKQTADSETKGRGQ